MAEATSDTMHIRLHVYDEEIEVVIDRREEERYRAAARLITDRYNTYAKIYKGHKSGHTIALMTLIDIALQLEEQRSRNDTTPYNDILAKLTEEMEDVLGEKS